MERVVEGRAGRQTGRTSGVMSVLGMTLRVDSNMRKRNRSAQETGQATHTHTPTRSKTFFWG
jgi:hypothetical protein